MYNATVLASCASNVGIVWFYTLIILIVLTVFIIYILFSYFVISPVTGSSDLFELNIIQYGSV